MWKKNKSNRDILNLFCDRINYVMKSIDEIHEQDYITSEVSRELYKDKGYIKLKKIYYEILKHQEQYSDLIDDDLTFRFVGDSIKTIIDKIEIDINDMLEEYSYEDLDRFLYTINIYEKNDSQKLEFVLKRDYLYIYTIFDNYLLDLTKDILERLSTFSDEKIASKVYQFGRNSLLKKIEWFLQFGNSFNKQEKEVKLFSANRNAIVHNCSKYSFNIIDRLDQKTIQENNICEGKKITLSKEKLIICLDLVSNLSQDIHESVYSRFITDKDKIKFQAELKAIKKIANDKNELQIT